VLLRWGLIPSWAKDPSIGARMINARAETLAEKPAFRSAFRKRRCLVAADGFYEWQKRGVGPKQPYRIARRDGGPFAFAGLWERWRDPAEGRDVESCTIVTTGANELLSPIHHRMPVILAPASYGLWLDPGAELDRVQELLAGDPGVDLLASAISTRVNKVANDDPEVLLPLEGASGGEAERSEQAKLL
jgi:putative SOS response-associated peptidase YedK